VNGDLLRVETLETLKYIILVDSEEVEHKVMLCIINDTATIFIPNCEKASISTYLFGNNNLNSLIRDEYKHFFLEPINVSNIGMGARI
jgi:hypothetical protein